jgi:hypothetical protein
VKQQQGLDLILCPSTMAFDLVSGPQQLPVSSFLGRQNVDPSQEPTGQH